MNVNTYHNFSTKMFLDERGQKHRAVAQRYYLKMFDPPKRSSLDKRLQVAKNEIKRIFTLRRSPNSQNKYILIYKTTLKVAQ